MSIEKNCIPYGRQSIDDADIAAVCDVLKSDWLTTGPQVEEFERVICEYTGAQHGVAVASGTAALHAAMFAIGVRPGDEVIVSPMTFAASVNCIIYQGGTPVFADVCAETLLIDVEDVERKVTGKTKAIIAVDYAGQPCDYNKLCALADQHGITLVADGCHSLGGAYRGRRVGILADLTTCSFHPVKHITTGEGGMVLTNDSRFAARMRTFRNHGIDTDFRERAEKGAWFYEMRELGYNYRISDIQCALGISQLKKLPSWIERRQTLADSYRNALADISTVRPLVCHDHVSHAYHLFVLKIQEGSRDNRFLPAS